MWNQSAARMAAIAAPAVLTAKAMPRGLKAFMTDSGASGLASTLGGRNASSKAATNNALLKRPEECEAQTLRERGSRTSLTRSLRELQWSYAPKGAYRAR